MDEEDDDDREEEAEDEADEESDEAEDEDEDDDRPRRRKPTKDEKTMAMYCHFGGILGFVVPLVLWLTQKEKSAFIDEHGKEAVNFAITLLTAQMVSGVLICCTFGALNIIVMVMGIVYHVQAGNAASRGEYYQYPYCIRLVK